MLSGLVLGAAAGAGAMFFLSPRSGKANRRMVQNKVQEIGDYLQEEKELLEERVEDIFGEVSALTTALYQDARKLWDNQVRALSKSLEKIDRKAYQEMVESVIEKLQVSKKYDDSNLSKVKRYLNSQWSRFQEMEG
jgi:gas vesicle protein